MKTAIIIHGMPSKEEYLNPEVKSPSNAHWLPWIQKKLILEGALAQTPEMPEPYAPTYESWKHVFEQFVINEETILIGHSCGAGFLVEWLSKNKNVKVGQVVLVAPWIDPKKELAGKMFDFEIDSELPKRTSGLTVIYSTDDAVEMIRSVEILKQKLRDVTIKEFTNKRHFTFNSLKTDAFPELLEVLK